MKPNKLLVFCGTSLYTGYIPLGPGTFASILAIPLVVLLSRNSLSYLIVTIIITLLGVFSARYLSKIWQKQDDQRITIDEFAGMLITLLFIKINWWIILSGLVLFRFFDIIKPLYIRKVEHISGGVGIMLDDILAGIYANLCLRIILLIAR